MERERVWLLRRRRYADELKLRSLGNLALWGLRIPRGRGLRGGGRGAGDALLVGDLAVPVGVDHFEEAVDGAGVHRQ